MSTIQVTNINDLSDNAALVTDNGGIKTDKLTGKTTAGSISVVGEGNSTTTNLQQGLCKAWCNFLTNSGTSANDSFNLASITDDAVGRTLFNWTNSFASTSFTAAGGDEDRKINNSCHPQLTSRARSLMYHTQDNTDKDTAGCSIACQGDLA